MTRMKLYFPTLMTVFQVIAVTSARNDLSDAPGGIYQYLSKFSLTTDVITVGSVSAVSNDVVKLGQKHPLSHGGFASKISTSGRVQCVRNSVLRNL